MKSTRSREGSGRFQPICWTAGALKGLVAVTLFALMLLTCLDVGGRYAFNRPVPGTSELVQFGMGMLVFGALPLVTGRQGHVTIGLLEMVLPGRVDAIQRVAMALTGGTGLAVLSWRLGTTGIDLASYGDTTSFLRLPLAPMAWFMSVMAALSALAALAHLRAPATRPAE